RIVPSGATAEISTDVVDAAGLKMVTAMLPWLAGPKGTMTSSEPAAGATDSKLPEPSPIVATAEIGAGVLIRTVPVKEERPKDAAVSRCWDRAAIMTTVSASLSVFESSRATSAFTAALLRLPRTTSDRGWLLKSGKTY